MDNHLYDILENLEYGREELPLLLKIIDYLRCIDNKIGSPLNSMNNLVSIIYNKLIIIKLKNNKVWMCI